MKLEVIVHIKDGWTLTSDNNPLVMGATVPRVNPFQTLSHIDQNHYFGTWQ